MIKLLEQCVRIPSLSGQEQRVAEFLRDEMLARGFDKAFVDESGSAVGIIGNGPRQLVLLGHMDTVGGDVPVRYEENKLYGRGTVDAKGPLCAFILAVAQAHPVIANSQWQIIVIGATEEEAASSRGAHHAVTQYQPELCIIGEPSGSDGITLGYKGRLLARAHFEQAIAHTSRPEPTSSEQAVNFWNWAKQFAETYNADKPKMFDQVMPGLRSIKSGDDGLREWCDVTIGLRLPLTCGPDEIAQRFSAQFDLMGADEGCELTFFGSEQAYRSSKDTVLARAFVDAIREEKLRPAFKVKSGTADFNILGPAWNCPIVAYGPGDSDLDHTPIEHVEIDEFERGVRVLTRVLRNLTL
jgi:[amino group carrier protein]-lysine/ornithine hydrolase